MKLLRLLILTGYYLYAYIGGGAISLKKNFILGVVPVSQDATGVLKFKVFSWKTFLSYASWVGIQLVCIGIFHYREGDFLSLLKHENSVTWVFTRAITIINTYLIPIVIPGLLAFILENSNTNLDANKFTKLKMLVTLTISRCVTLVITIYLVENGDIYSQMSVGVFFIIYCTILNFSLIVINLICNSFIEEVEEARNILQIDGLTDKYIDLVNKYRGMKRGFSPFLLIFMSFCTVYVLFFSFLLTDHLEKKNYLSSINIFSGVFYYLFLMFYIIGFCDETFGALSANNNILRYALQFKMFI